MRGYIAGLAIATGCVLLSSGAMAQAAAEGALTHALSSGVGSSMGNAMGKVTNRMAGRVAQQTSQAVPRQNTTGVRRNGVATAPANGHAANAGTVQPGEAGASASSGPMIVSIQGGVKPEAECGASAANTSSASAKNGRCAAADPAAVAHPAEITLPAPK